MTTPPREPGVPFDAEQPPTAPFPDVAGEPAPYTPGTGTAGTAPVGSGHPEATTTVPEDPKVRGSATAATWIALILGAIVLILLLIFVIQNNTKASFTYFSGTFDLPLGVAMLLAAIAGALVMALVGSVRIFQLSWRLRRMRKHDAELRSLVNGR